MGNKSDMSEERGSNGKTDWEQEVQGSPMVGNVRTT